MTTFNTVRDDILQWIEDITSRPSLLANQSQSVSLDVPYIEMQLTQNDIPDSQNISLSQDGLTETISSEILITCVLNVYGGAAMQDALKLSRSLHSSARYEDLWQSLGLGGIGTVQDLTALETGEMKDRAQMEISFYATMSESFTSDYIDNIDITVQEEINPFSETFNGGSNPHPIPGGC